MNREIHFYEKHFIGFYLTLDKKIQEKIDYVLMIVKTVDRIPQKFIKHIEGTDGLHEIRVKVGNNIYRIFSCFDDGNLVVLFNAFQKKSQKTPLNEIQKAVLLKHKYFDEKKKR